MESRHFVLRLTASLDLTVSQSFAFRTDLPYGNVMSIEICRGIPGRVCTVEFARLTDISDIVKRSVNSNQDWQMSLSNITTTLYAFQNGVGRVQPAAAWQHRTDDSNNNLASEGATLEFPLEVF